MLNATTLHPVHQTMGARLIPFGGWDMPLHYGSQVEEHHQVRRHAGMFDVSHMAIIDLQGPETKAFLQRLLANDVDKLKTSGKALYGCMLQEDGGIIDDLITYWRGEDRYRLVVNAATTAKDLAWIRQQAEGAQLSLLPREDLDMIAVQGPAARELVADLLKEGEKERLLALPVFTGADFGDRFIARTGYTGEDGVEIMLPKTETKAAWTALHQAGVAPCGLGARDTLRLEAGMNLYGTDMNESLTPLESGLGWTLAWEPRERDFIGRSALEAQRKAGGLRRFTGLVLEGKGILRGGQQVLQQEREVGTITSGGFSPTLGCSIAMARLDADANGPLKVSIRGKALDLKLAKLPFVRQGQSLLNI